MPKRIKFLIILSIVIAALFINHQYQKYAFEIYKTDLISGLELYKNKNGNYPKNLDALKLKQDKDLYYSLDSINNSYSISYTTGIMNSNTHFYDSKTKAWTEKFNY